MVEGVRLVIDEAEAGVVRRIFTMYADGYSLKLVAKSLNTERVSSPQPQRGRLQRSWAPSAVRHILLNERYVGRVVWNTKKKVRNPKTGRRVYRPRPTSDWICKEAPELRIVSDDLWKRVGQRFEFVRTHYGAKSRSGLLDGWNAVGSPYLFSGILRCGLCGANMNIVSGAGKRAYSKYGCPMHHFRNTCENALTERSKILEERLLQSLQEQVMREDVVDYTIKKFESELKKKFSEMSGELESLRRRDQVLEGQIRRLTDTLALGNSSEPPAAIVAAISEREAERRSIAARLLESGGGSIEAKLEDIREFVTSRMKDLRTLLYADVPKAKAELLKHVGRIELHPMEVNGERFFTASGEFDLVGDYPSRKSGGAAGRS